MQHRHIVRRPVIKKACDFPQNLHPVLKRVYAGRGIDSMELLDLALKRVMDYRLLKDIDRAVDLLVDAIKGGMRILVVGDFDADGATSSALAVLALRAMGASWVSYLVPNRFEYGYGLSAEIVEVALKQQPQLIITVDNGISSIAGVHAARQAGVKVLVTDHHLPGDELPLADAIVNPNQHDCPFPGKNTAGCGVIFYVMCALRARLRELGWFQGILVEPNLAELLDIVALGTVADVVSLDHNNRILVHQGLQRMRAGQCRPGIQALVEVAGRQLSRLTAADLGFALGPRLNAAGRLDDMSMGIELLLCDDLDRAREMAKGLDGLNKERRQIEKEMKEQAVDALKSLAPLTRSPDIPGGVCLFQPQWHQGVIGILASRIKEQVHRPVIAFACADEHEIKGSGRSIAGFHLRDALDRVDKLAPGLIKKFGGHAMAAGLTIARVDFDRFCQLFNQVAVSMLTPDLLQAEVVSDGELRPEEFSMELAQILRQGGPWGQSFPEPLFDGEFVLVQQRLVGSAHLKMVLQLPDTEFYLDAIAFNVDRERWPDPTIGRVRIAYRLDINEFRGQRSLQLIVEYLESLAVVQ